MLRFIHVGKTGGSTITTILKQKHIKFKQYHFNKSYKNNEKYIIWIRNPLTRFVSAFNMSKSLVYFNCNIPINMITSKNCLNVRRIINKIRNKKTYAYSPKYDKLIKFFGNANNLAVSLTSEDINIKRKAHKLMNISCQGHMFNGTGWYLNNGNFVKERNKDILFVGKTETMSKDINKLSIILNTQLNTNVRAKNNKFSTEKSKYLSPLAIENLIQFYKDTDYAALIELKNYGWITEEDLESYYKYP
jgi:hypothetical protein